MAAEREQAISGTPSRSRGAGTQEARRSAIKLANGGRKSLLAEVQGICAALRFPFRWRSSNVSTFTHQKSLSATSTNAGPGAEQRSPGAKPVSSVQFMHF
ncbi:MAG: hypothetical protein MI923_20045 [Phycisphaerales bacterium]|nr:hypothetical protein [Phycisphaerales bacterium]